MLLPLCDWHPMWKTQPFYHAQGSLFTTNKQNTEISIFFWHFFKIFSRQYSGWPGPPEAAGGGRQGGGDEEPAGKSDHSGAAGGPAGQNSNKSHRPVLRLLDILWAKSNYYERSAIKNTAHGQCAVDFEFDVYWNVWSLYTFNAKAACSPNISKP